MRLLANSPGVVGIAEKDIDGRIQMPREDRRLVQRGLRLGGPIGENQNDALGTHLRRRIVR